MSERKPIVMNFGLPRSGTTLVERMITDRKFNTAWGRPSGPGVRG
jgi:hypothetical protein